MGINNYWGSILLITSHSEKVKSRDVHRNTRLYLIRQYEQEHMQCAGRTHVSCSMDVLLDSKSLGEGKLGSPSVSLQSCKILITIMVKSCCQDALLCILYNSKSDSNSFFILLLISYYFFLILRWKFLFRHCLYS